MYPCKADLEIYQGDDYICEVAVYTVDDAVADLTGYTARAEIRRKTADLDPEVVAELQTTIDPSGFIMLGLNHVTTATLTGRYVWDLEVTAPDGLVSTILAGQAVIAAEVTRNGVARL